MRVLVLRYLAPFIAFAFGVAATRPSRMNVQIAPVEAGLLIASLVGAFLVYGTWRQPATVLVIALVTFFLGAITSYFVVRRSPMMIAGTREFEPKASVELRPSLWKRYLNFSRRVADVEVRIVLVLAYIIVLAPVAAIARLATEERAANESTWRSRSGADTLQSARRPF